MNYIVEFYNFISATFETPAHYGPFHLISIGLVILASVLLCIFLRNCSDRTMRIMLFVCWTVIAVLEVLDQFVEGTTVLEDGTLAFDYAWYRFPFQLCSTALWILPFIILIPDNKIRDGLIGYMTLFSFFGGLAVMIYPGDVFTANVITSVHTMVHHGMQVVLGVFFISHERKKYCMRYFAGGVACFLILLGIACVMNEVAREIFLAYGQTDSFNMFYVSPYETCNLPILVDIQKVVPYPIFFMIYCFGFIFIAFVIYFIASLTNHIVDRVRHADEYVEIK